MDTDQLPQDYLKHLFPCPADSDRYGELTSLISQKKSLHFPLAFD